MQGGRVNRKNKTAERIITKIVGANNRSKLTAGYGGNAHAFAANMTKSHGSGLISGQSLSD